MSFENGSLESRYYRGSISVVNPGSRTGWLRTERGCDVFFAAAHLTLLGTSTFAALRPGLHVGYDLGRASSGLCATAIRVYDTP